MNLLNLLGEFKMEIGTKLYQICCIGRYRSFDAEGKYNSKEVYLRQPNKDEIESFIHRCCNSEYPNNLYDLDESTVTININELELN